MHVLPYRLVVDCDTDPRALCTMPYADFISARSDVARVVRAASTKGRVRRVFLEERVGDRWRTTSRWNSDVVERILLQDALREHNATANGQPFTPPPAEKPVAWAPRHRPTRYAMATGGMALATALCSIMMWQAEGHPIEMAQFLLEPPEPVAPALPFVNTTAPEAVPSRIVPPRDYLQSAQ